MAANLPMAANGQLMMQQQQQQQHQMQQQQHQMQQRQLHGMVYQQLANSHQLAGPNGWQSSLSIQDRLAKTINLLVLNLPFREAFFVFPRGGAEISPPVLLVTANSS